MDIVLNNLENIELVVDNINKTKFNFPDIENIRGKKIKVIDIPSVNEVTVTPLGKANINDTVYGKSFLVLNVAGSEKINRIPLKSLNPFANNTRLFFNDLVVDWTRSYIEVGSTAGLVANEAFFLNVFF